MLGLTEYLILSLLPKQHPPRRAIAKILEIVRSFVLDLLKRFSCLLKSYFSSQILTALKSPSLSNKLSWEAQLQEQAILLCSLLSFVLFFFVKLRCGVARQGELVNFEFSGCYTWRSLVLFCFVLFVEINQTVIFKHFSSDSTKVHTKRKISLVVI